MRWVRTWLPVVIIVAGVALAAITRTEEGIEGGVLLVSAGLSVWLLNWFYRVSVSGERDRDTEDEARAYFSEHGHWPDEGRPPGGDPPAAANRPEPPTHRPSAGGGRPPSPRRGHRPKP